MFFSDIWQEKNVPNIHRSRDMAFFKKSDRDLLLFLSTLMSLAGVWVAVAGVMHFQNFRPCKADLWVSWADKLMLKQFC